MQYLTTENDRTTRHILTEKNSRGGGRGTPTSRESNACLETQVCAHPSQKFLELRHVIGTWCVSLFCYCLSGNLIYYGAFYYQSAEWCEVIRSTCYACHCFRRARKASAVIWQDEYAAPHFVFSLVSSYPTHDHRKMKRFYINLDGIARFLPV